MTPSEEHGPEEQTKSNENSDKNAVKCNQCKKTVREKVQCKKCKGIFHPSCLVIANKSKNSTCVHEQDEKQDMVDSLINEIKLLKRVIIEQEEKYALLKENKVLLEENSRLLKEKTEQWSQGKEIKVSYSEAAKSMEPKTKSRRNEKSEPKAKKIDVQQSHVETADSLNENKNSKQIPSTSKINNTQKIAQVENEADLIISESDDENEQEKHENWQIQKARGYRRKYNKPLFYGSSEEDTTRGIPRRIWYFVSRLNPEMTEEQLKALIVKKCSSNTTNIVVEKQKLYNNYQSAFKVGVPLDMREQANNASFWPKDSRIDKFNFFRQRRQTREVK